MQFDELKYAVRADLYRYKGKSDANAFASTYLLSAGFTYTFWWRISRYLSESKSLAAYPAKYLLLQYSYKFGISIPLHAQIGPGLYIPHFGGIVINSASSI